MTARRTKRIYPAIENSAIRLLRGKPEVRREDLLSLAVSRDVMDQWRIKEQILTEDHPLTHALTGAIGDRIEQNEADVRPIYSNPAWRLRVNIIMTKLLIGHARIFIPFIKDALHDLFSRRRENRVDGMPDDVASPLKKKGTPLGFIIKGFGFLRYLLNWPNYVFGRAIRCFHDLRVSGVHEVAIVGTGTVAQLMWMISKKIPIKITAVYDVQGAKKKFMGRSVAPLETLSGFSGKIIIASIDEIPRMIGMLKDIGVTNASIIDLW